MSIVLVGSTSGSITLQEPAIAGTTVLDLPAVSGTILTTTSPKAGNVIQVVQGTTSTSATTTGSTYIDTNLSASITPSSSSSKILIIVSQNGCLKNNNIASGVNLRLMRDATVIQGIAVAAFYTSSTEFRTSISSSYLDSPATTSAITYKTQFSNDGTGTGSVSVQNNTTNSLSTIILMEIAA